MNGDLLVSQFRKQKQLLGVLFMRRSWKILSTTGGRVPGTLSTVALGSRDTGGPPLRKEKLGISGNEESETSEVRLQGDFLATSMIGAAGHRHSSPGFIQVRLTLRIARTRVRDLGAATAPGGGP